MTNRRIYRFKNSVSFNEIDNQARLESLAVVRPTATQELTLSLTIKSDGTFTASGNSMLPGITTEFVDAEDSGVRVRAFHAKTDPCPWAGKYTFAFNNLTNNGTTTPPGGDSIGTATVRGDGLMTLRGTLADGTRFSVNSRPSEDGTYLVFFTPGKTLGSYFQSTFTISQRADEWYHVAENQGTARWVKPANARDLTYRDGFDASLDVQMVEWKSPAKGQLLRDFLGFGEFNIVDINFFGGLSTTTYADFLPTSLGLTARNSFRVASAAGRPSVMNESAWAKIFSSKINPSTGLITVRINITDLVNGKSVRRAVTVNGVFVQLEDIDLSKPYAFGHLLIPPLDRKTGTITSGGFNLPGPFEEDEILLANANTAGTYTAVLEMLPNPSPMPTGIPGNNATVNFTISPDLQNITFAGRKLPLVGDSRPVSLAYTDAQKKSTNNATVTVYLNGSGQVHALATQYFQLSGITVRIRNHNAISVTKN